MIPTSTIRSDEIARFNRLAATWWNSTGPMRPLHVLNEHRLDHVLEQIAERFGRSVGRLQGLRIADVGCGRGAPLSAGARVERAGWRGNVDRSMLVAVAVAVVALATAAARNVPA